MELENSGVLGKSEKEIKEGLKKLATHKAKQKALVTQLQFQKIVIQAKAPTKEHFQPDKTMSGKRTVSSIQQLTEHLTEIVELNISQEPESEGDGGVTF